MKKYLALIVALAGYGIFARLMPHAPNFAPITALALVGGLYLPKRLAYIVPMGAMLLSDLIIGFYHPLIMISVYSCFLLTVFFGTLVKKQKNLYSVLGITLTSSILFYLVTNAMVWAFGGLYPHTLTGLTESYFLALPFFRNSLISDLFYTGVLVGGIEAIKLWTTKRQTATSNDQPTTI